MLQVVNVLIGIAVLVVAVWIAIFGGVGAVLCRSRGGARATGFTWGMLLGPIGWLVVYWVTRKTAAEATSF